VYTVSAGLARGRRASVVAAFGCTLGILPHLAAAIIGLAGVLYTSSVVFETLRYLGVLYLLCMAAATLRERGPLRFELGGRMPAQARGVIVRAVLLNLLNPKLSLFFFAFMPQFVRAGDPNRLVHMLILSGVFVVATFGVFVLYGVAAAAVRQYLLARERALAWLRRAFAAAFVGLAARLALSER